MSPQERLKLVLSPIWSREMGIRLAIIRMKQGKIQAEFAARLSTPELRISQQLLAEIELGHLTKIQISWARLESVLGQDTSYVLIGANAEKYNASAIASRFKKLRLELRKRNGVDPKEMLGVG